MHEIEVLGRAGREMSPSFYASRRQEERKIGERKKKMQQNEVKHTKKRSEDKGQNESKQTRKRSCWNQVAHSGT